MNSQSQKSHSETTSLKKAWGAFWVFVLLLVVPSFGAAAPQCSGIFSRAFSNHSEAIDVLFNDHALPWRHRWAMGKESRKIAWFKYSSDVKVSIESQQALTFLLQDISTPVTKKFRKKLFAMAPSVFKGADLHKVLMPFARGVRTSIPEDIYYAHHELKQQGVRLGQSSMSTSIKSVSKLGGGWNTSLLVEFNNGIRAVFKPFFGQNNMGPSEHWVDRVAFNREVTAYVIIEKYLGNAQSRKMGLSSIATPQTVEANLVHDGISYGVGSLQLYVENAQGYTALKNADPKGFMEMTSDFNWISVEARVRTIDFILGNPDRFENKGLEIPHYAAANLDNLMIEKQRNLPAKIILIDNAFGRPGIVKFDERYLPKISDIPMDLKAAIINFDQTSFKQEMKDLLPEEGIQDLLNRVGKLQTLFKDEAHQ